MFLEEMEADDDALARMQALDSVNPLFRAAMARRLEHDARQRAVMDSMWPAQHPFECDRKARE